MLFKTLPHAVKLRQDKSWLAPFARPLAATTSPLRSFNFLLQHPPPSQHPPVLNSNRQLERTKLVTPLRQYRFLILDLSQTAQEAARLARTALRDGNLAGCHRIIHSQLSLKLLTSRHALTSENFREVTHLENHFNQNLTTAKNHHLPTPHTTTPSRCLESSTNPSTRS